MATCSLTGTLLDPSGIAISGATVAANVVTPCFDASGNFIVPKDTSTTTSVSGVFTIVLDQGLSITLTIQYPPNTTDSIKRYNYNFTVPSTPTATFNSTLITEL